MDDNQIRIPSVDLKPSVDQLSELYQSLTAPCVQVNSQQPVPENFCSTYSQVTGDMQNADFPFPVADNKRKRSVSPSDPTATKTGREICNQNAETLFGIALDAANTCPPDFPIILSHVHDGIYMARRAGWSDDQISKSIEPIRDALKPCLEKELPLPSPPTPPNPSPPLAAPLPKRKSFYFFAEVEGGPHLDSFHSVDATGAVGVKYFSGPDRRLIIQVGLGENVRGSLNSLDPNPNAQLNDISGYSPQLLLGGGYAFSAKGPEILFDTHSSVHQLIVTTYNLATTDVAPIVTNTTVFDLDLILQAQFHGIFVYGGYRVGESLHGGIGYQQVIGIK